jgi:hypothetical protein
MRLNYGLRYGLSVVALLSVFKGFVACGAQLYKISLEDDNGARLDGRKDYAVHNVQMPYGLHAPGGWTQLPIQFRIGNDLTQEQVKGLQRAMNTWESAVGRKLFSFVGIHQGITGDSFPDLYSSLNDRINGHYLDEHWSKTGKPSIVLATTIWDNDPDHQDKILTADIRFNSDYYNIGDSLSGKNATNKEMVDMQTLALHELGHLLGLAHIDVGVDSQSIMNPSVFIGEGLANRRLSRGDIERIQKIYGCSADSCNVDKLLAEMDATEVSQRKKPLVSSKQQISQ